VEDVTRNRLATVIGHRGAAGYRPEHTLESYRLAFAHRAEAVEPDLVMTADGVAVLRHETEIGATTDVALHPEFAGRHTARVVEGREVTGWFCEDFTLAELKTLRAVERLPARRPGNTRWDGLLEIATFDELLMLLAEESRRRGRRVGLYAELKSPAHLASVGLPVEDAVLGALRDHGLDRRGSGVQLQSFETGSLRMLRERTDLPLVQLVEAAGAPADLVAAGDPTTYDDLCSPGGLRAVARYADAIGVAHQRLLARPELVEEAHVAGLRVLAWTVRHDDPEGCAQVEADVRTLLDAGVDGLFSDHPDATLRVRRRPRGADPVHGSRHGVAVEGGDELPGPELGPALGQSSVWHH
jgi:glycerophosphoryl diester phosphodiesterase